MRELYNKVLNNINKIDFNKIWNGFNKYEFAIYNSKEVYFKDKTIPWDQRFIGSTAIKYEDRYIAIWNIEFDLSNNKNISDIDTDILTSNLVHEMFHAYQQENEETRVPYDLVTLNYPNDINNFCLKYEENKLLAKAVLENNLNAKRQIIESFYSIRVKRKQIIGDMIKCEYLTETAEGMAEFAGIMALKQLSQEKYQDRIKLYSKYLQEFSPLQLDIRRISYYVGAIFLVISYDLDLKFEHSLSNQSKTVFEIIAENFNYTEIDNLQLEKDLMEKVINENIAYKKGLIDKFMQSTNRKATSGDFKICGYDPMNMIKLNNKILCKTFIALTNQDSNENITYLGETLLEMQSNTINKVACFYR